MTHRYIFPRPLLVLCLVSASVGLSAAETEERRLLYLASPGIRNYLEHGGHGILVYDIDHGHKFVKRIPIQGLNAEGEPLNIKGVCASADTNRIYVSTLQHMMCLDLITEELVWEYAYEKGCDRMSMSPDGSLIYLPTLEKDHWKVIDAKSGKEIARVSPNSGAHNTIYGLSGRFAYLAGLRSPFLTVTETESHTVAKRIGPFGDSIRPFTVNGAETLCFVNVNKLLGFEVGDLTTGEMLHRVEVTGFAMGKIKRHGCPSHGIGMTPDEKEIWLSDGANSHVHIFDATVMPPKQVASIELRDQPGWVTFTLRGDYAYPSTGDVIDTRSRKIVARLTDERHRMVESEKVLEIDFRGSEPIRAGDQFGLGRVR